MGESPQSVSFPTKKGTKIVNAKAESSTKRTLKAAPRRAKRTKESHVFPVEPRVIQVIKKPRTYVNHSYRDFSDVPAEEGYKFPEHVWGMSFPEKVHHMLMQEEYQDWIAWSPHFRSFSVLVPKMFEENVLPKYLGHTRYSSFLRQLANYGFRTLTKRGPELNSHYHEFMLRGMPHLAKYMPKPKDARRQIPDPENEPNFYEISRRYPLTDDPYFGKNDDLSDSQARPEPTKTKRISPVPQSSVASGLPRFVANPTPATTRLGVTLTANAALSVAPATALAAAPLPALAVPHMAIQVAYPSIPGITVPVVCTIPATAVADTNHAAIAAALRAGIAIGQGQSLEFPVSSLNAYQLQGLLLPHQGRFGGRF